MRDRRGLPSLQRAKTTAEREGEEGRISEIRAGKLVAVSVSAKDAGGSSETQGPKKARRFGGAISFRLQGTKIRIKRRSPQGALEQRW